jgi:hypothetical protein
MRRRHVLALVAALPMLGGSICGEVLADITQRELILEPIEEITFDIDSGSVEVYAFNRNGTSLFYYLVGSFYDIGDYGWELVGDRLEVVSPCDSDEHCNLDWYAEVSFGVGVHVVTRNGGVKITGVDAPVVVDAVGGGFDGALLRAPAVDVVIEAGDVTIDMIAQPMDVRIEVGEGNVELTLPPGAYRCELTADGDVDTTGVTCDPTATSVVQIDVEAGNITLLPGPMP